MQHPPKQLWGYMRRDSNMANANRRSLPPQPAPYDRASELPPTHVGEREAKERKFSIVFPTRERLTLVSNLLKSLNENTSNLDDIEVLTVTDNDDRTNYEVFRQYPWLTQYRVQRSLNFSRDYYNHLAAHSKGRWIIACNDDCQFETKNWDVIAYDILKDKSNVILGVCEDGLDGFRQRGGGKYPCFPLFGREGVKALGFVFPPRIPVWGADMWSRNIYDHTKSIVDIPIRIMHYCHHNRTREQDGISKRIAQNQVAYSIQPTREEADKLIAAYNRETSKV